MWQTKNVDREGPASLKLRNYNHRIYALALSGVDHETVYDK